MTTLSTLSASAESGVEIMANTALTFLQLRIEVWLLIQNQVVVSNDDLVIDPFNDIEVETKMNAETVTFVQSSWQIRNKISSLFFSRHELNFMSIEGLVRLQNEIEYFDREFRSAKTFKDECSQVRLEKFEKGFPIDPPESALIIWKRRLKMREPHIDQFMHETYTVRIECYQYTTIDVLQTDFEGMKVVHVFDITHGYSGRLLPSLPSSKERNWELLLSNHLRDRPQACESRAYLSRSEEMLIRRYNCYKLTNNLPWLYQPAFPRLVLSFRMLIVVQSINILYSESAQIYILLWLIDRTQV